MERTRQLDRREDRLFEQFRDCVEKTRSKLNEAALLRQRAARLERELQHAREAAAAAAERSQPTRYNRLPSPNILLQTLRLLYAHSRLSIASQRRRCDTSLLLRLQKPT